jgi:hypothetical protein
VPAWGRPGPFERERRIPADDFHADMIEETASWWILAKRPRSKVIAQIDGTVGTSQRYAKYKGPPWSAIKVDSARLRQAHPRPLTMRVEPAPADPSAGAGEQAAPAPAPVVSTPAGSRPADTGRVGSRRGSGFE